MPTHGLHWNAHTCAHTTQIYANTTQTQCVFDKYIMCFVYSQDKTSILLLSTDGCSEVSRPCAELHMKSRRVTLCECGKHSKGTQNLEALVIHMSTREEELSIRSLRHTDGYFKALGMYRPEPGTMQTHKAPNLSNTLGRFTMGSHAGQGRVRVQRGWWL